MKKLTLILALLVTMVTTAMAQNVYLQKINHVNWTVTALNEAGTSGNEGGVAYIADADPKTFYHSNWNSNYTDGNGVNKGKDGLQAFMIELPMEYSDISKITYTGRSDKSGNNPSGWATKVRIYLYQTLPADLSAKALSALTYAEKEALLVASNTTVLGEPVFNNNNNPWSGDQVKTVELATPQAAKYVLFVMDASTDGWLTCSDFNIYQNLTLDEGVEIKEIDGSKPYYLKIKNAKRGECYLDIKTPHGDTQGLKTIGISNEPVAAYFKNMRGTWRISSEPGYDSNSFLGVSKWCAPPQVEVPASFFVEYNSDGTFALLQDTYKGEGENNNTRCYLGGDAILENAEQIKIYTGADKANAINIELVELNDLETAKENARVALAKTGPGYPATNSEARTTLEAAMNGTDATAINDAVATYKATFDEDTEIANVALPEVGKVYRFVSALPGYFEQQIVRKAMYNNSIQLMWQNYNKDALNQMWAVMDCNTDNQKVTFINLDDARSPQGNFLMRQTPNYCTLAYLGGGQFKIKSSNGGTMHTNNHGGGAGNESNIVSWDNVANTASAWYIEEVDVTKDMITAFAGKIDAAYAQSCLLTNKSTDLANAVNTVKEATNENYASAFVNLMTTLSNTEINYIDEGYFYMKSKESGWYAYNNNNTDIYAKQEKTPASIFKFVKAAEGTYYIQTDCGLYVQGVVDTKNAVLLNTTSVDYRVERLTSSDHYVLRKRGDTDNYHYMHQATSLSNKVVGWSTDANNTKWSLEPLNAEELEKIYTLSEINTQNASAPTITYNNDSYTGNKVIKQAGGFYMLDAAPSETDFTVTPAAEAPLINLVSVNGKNLSLNVGYNGENVFTMRCVKENSYARYHKDCWLNEDSITNMITYEGKIYWESLFLMEEGTGDYTGYYTIRPLAALDRYAYNLATADEDSKVATKEAPAEGGLTGAYYWKITQNGEDTYNITPYHNGENTGDAYGWNRRGSYEGKNHIGYWKDHNDANDNKWYVKTMEQEFIPIHTLDDSVLGYANYESVEEHLPYTKAITEDGFEKLKAGKYDVVLPTIGAYYTLKNEKSNKFMTGNKENITIEESAKDVESIFYVDEGYSLMSYFAGRYLDTKAKGYSDIGTKLNGKFSKVYGGYKENTLAYYNNDNRWTYGGGDTGGGGSNGLDQGSANEVPNNTGYNWVFTKVTSLPVTISAAGYASWYAPVAVIVPEGLEAYYLLKDNIKGPKGDRYASMSKIECGVIPANEGVILTGKYGGKAVDKTYDFIITTIEDDSDEKDETDIVKLFNILEGTVATEYVTDDAYVLSKPNGKEIGFYLADMNKQNNTAFQNNSHKAYLPASEVPADALQSAGFRFSFGGTTDIEEVETESSEVNAIYDLTGRKLEGISGAGIYIINGKKVIVR